MKVKVKAEVPETQLTPLNETGLAIRETALRVGGGGLDYLAHRDRVFKVRDEINHWFSKEEVEALHKSGFYWFVTLDFVKRFKYHASVGTRPSCVYIRGSSRVDVLYKGDIPDFALDRIERAKGVRLSSYKNIYDAVKWRGIEYLTIHSMQPLPVEFRLSDPVVVGWKFSPSIRLGRDGNLTESTFREYGSDVMGVVVAAWDLDKEIEVI